MKKELYLGTLSEGGRLFITKHDWSCGWYWSFGWLSTKNSSFHFSAFLQNAKTAKELFSRTHLTDSQWWILRDLFKSAYALRDAAEAYQYGGHQTSEAGPYRIIDQIKANSLNTDLRKLLDTIWELLLKWEKGE